MKDSYKLPCKLDPFVRVEDYIYINILAKDKLLEQMQQLVHMQKLMIYPPLPGNVH